jgi:hypothetical protein
VATTPYEIIAGPADVWIGDTTATFPLIDEDVAAEDGWFSLGDTEGGVTVRHTQSVELLRTDQSPGPKKAIRSEEGLEVEFALANLTLERWAKALDDVTVSTTAAAGTVAGSKSIKPFRGLDVKQYALVVRGPSPYLDGNLQFEVPVCVQTEEPEAEFVRDDKAVLAVMLTALEDPNAATEDDKFGTVRAQNTA